MLITMTYKEKYFLEQLVYFGSQSCYESFLIILLRFFVRLSVIAVVCYFSVYRLIGWDSNSTENKKKE